MGVEAGRGPVDGGQQHGAFGGEPGRGLLMVGGLFRGDSGLGRCEIERVAGRVQQPFRGVRAVQVVVEHPVGGGVPLLLRIGGVGQVGGVGAQQVVEGVPAGGVRRPAR